MSGGYQWLCSIKQVWGTVLVSGLVGLLSPDLILDQLTHEVNEEGGFLVPQLLHRYLSHNGISLWCSSLIIANNLWTWSGANYDLSHDLIVLAGPVHLVDLLHNVLGLQDVEAAASGLLLCAHYNLIIINNYSLHMSGGTIVS